MLFNFFFFFWPTVRMSFFTMVFITEMLSRWFPSEYFIFSRILNSLMFDYGSMYIFRKPVSNLVCSLWTYFIVKMSHLCSQHESFHIFKDNASS